MANKDSDPLIPKDEHGKPVRTFVLQEKTEGVEEGDQSLRDRSERLLKLGENRTKLGLYNREEIMPEPVVKFFSELQEAGGVVLVVKLDVDDLKKFNDTFTHEWADKIMKQLFQEKAEAFRKSDLFEFMMWQPQAGGDEVNLVLGFKQRDSRGEVISDVARSVFTGASEEPREKSAIADRLVEMVRVALRQPFVIEQPVEAGAEQGEELPEEGGDTPHTQEVGVMRMGFGIAQHQFEGKSLDDVQLQELGEKLFAQANKQLEEAKAGKTAKIVTELQALKDREGMTPDEFLVLSAKLLNGGRNSEELTLKLGRLLIELLEERGGLAQ